jgi:hypothetical protein
MHPGQVEIDPYASDPGHWGASLATLAELVLPCLQAVQPRRVVEVGAYAGDFTRLLLDWGADHGVEVVAIDPAPQPALEHLAAERPGLELVRKLSLQALREIQPPDMVILDGDHNYFTVSHELELIAQRAAAEGRSLPLILLHDVAWPHARRDTYHDPELVPPEHRQPLVEGPGLYPGVSGVRPGGLPYHWAAATEGGPRNGVLTAAEDFLAEHPELRLAVVPAFFGLGAIWSPRAPWSDAVAAILAPWDNHPLLARLEANRVLHLASSHFQMVEAARETDRNWHMRRLLEELLRSRAFALAERLSWLRRRGNPAFSRQQIRRLLEQDAAGPNASAG